LLRALEVDNLAASCVRGHIRYNGPFGHLASRRPATLAELSNPADTFLLVATRDYFSGGKYPGDALALAPESSYFGASACLSTAGHYFGSDGFDEVPATGSGPVAFADGHAKMRPARETCHSEAGWHRQSVDVWP